MNEFNPNSPQQMSALLFGGEIKVETVEPMMDENGDPVRFVMGAKAGQLKTRKVIKTKKIEGLGYKPPDEWLSETGKYYSTKKAILHYILSGTDEDTDINRLVNIFIQSRKIEKLISTYYDGVEKVLYPDSYVHPQYSHTSTATGRTSCTDPNLQNQPAENKIVKAHFISRFENGVIVDADYKGIEPRCEAQLCGDPNCIRDIVQNIDPHTKNLSLKLRKPYDEIVPLIDTELKSARRKIKGFTFSLQYGAGDATVARNSGLEIQEVQDLKQQRQLEYPRLHRYYQWLKDIVNKQGWYSDPWGRRYHFKKYKWRQGMSYSPTEVQNYRTQGFATGTVIPIMYGVFWREKAIYNRHKYLMINTVHDSVVSDCKIEYLSDLKNDLQILTEVGKISKEKFNYEFIVPIEIDINYGTDWSLC